MQGKVSVITEMDTTLKPKIMRNGNLGEFNRRGNNGLTSCHCGGKLKSAG